MGSVEALDAYMIMQQSEWAGRSFYTARDRRTGEVDYLVTEPASGSMQPYSHAHLPPLRCIRTDGVTRTMQGPIPEGRTLEDLRHQGELTEADLRAALLGVLDGLACLSATEPPVVPAYLDPACIKRDRLGRWVLDYLALAHATEARGAGAPPPGVYAFGALLFWLVTGHTVRLSRVDLNRIDHGLPASLQFLLLQCLTRSYPSLADLRADVERAGRDHAFRPVLQRLAGQQTRQSDPDVTDIPIISGLPTQSKAPEKPSPELQYYRVQLGGPQIPVDDRPWALPERPQEGFRKFVVPPAPDQAAVRRARLTLVAASGALVLLAAAGIAAKAGLVPDTALPAFLRHEQRAAAVSVGPDSHQAVPSNLLPDPPPPAPHSSDNPDERQLSDGDQHLAAEPPATGSDPPAPVPEPAPTTASGRPKPPQQIQPVPVQTESGLPKTDPKAAPVPAPEPEPIPASATGADQSSAQPEQTPPARPPRVNPLPGSSDDQDWQQGGLPVVVYVDGQVSGWAYMVPHPSSPWISLPTFNRLFQRSLYWVPYQGGMVRLINNDRSAATADFLVVQSRLWIKLSPPLQETLGVSVSAYDRTGIHFQTQSQ